MWNGWKWFGGLELIDMVGGLDHVVQFYHWEEKEMEAAHSGSWDQILA